MKVNNEKYKRLSIILTLMNLYLLVNLSLINYKRLDITGNVKTVHIILSVLLLIINIYILTYSFRVREDGVNRKLNKIIGLVCLIFSILSICLFIWVRDSEEKIALKLEENFQNYKSVIENGTTNEKVDALKNFLNDSTDNNKYFNRQLEILNQMENSSKLKRYAIIFIFNTYKGDSHNFNNSIRVRRRFLFDYYSIFFGLFLNSIINSTFYLMESIEQKSKEDIFYDNPNIE